MSTLAITKIRMSEDMRLKDLRPKTRDACSLDGASTVERWDCPTQEYLEGVFLIELASHSSERTLEITMKAILRTSAALLVLAALSCGDSSKPNDGDDENSGGSGTGSGGSGGGSAGGGESSGGGDSSGGGSGAQNSGGATAGGGASGGSSPDGGSNMGGATNGDGGSPNGSGGASDVPLPPVLTWTLAPNSGNLDGIWGSGPDNIYISADSNAIRHSTGDGTWTAQVYESGFTFNNIWGSGPDDIYVVGPGAVHFTINTGWQIPPQEITGGAPVYAMWGSSPTDLYVATAEAGGSNIYHSVGDGDWQSQEGVLAGRMNDIWGSDSTHIYAAGSQSVFFSTGDGSWEAQLTVADDVMNAVWTASADAVYVCTGTGRFYRSNGRGAWSEPQVLDPSLNVNCTAIWGTGTEDIYLATTRGVFHGTLP